MGSMPQTGWCVVILQERHAVAPVKVCSQFAGVGTLVDTQFGNPYRPHMETGTAMQLFRAPRLAMGTHGIVHNDAYNERFAHLLPQPRSPYVLSVASFFSC